MKASSIARIETAVDEPSRALMRQRQHRKEALAFWCGNIELVLARNRPERIRVMIGDGLNDPVGGQARDVFARGVHQRSDAAGIHGENHGAPCQLQHGHLIERAGGSRRDTFSARFPDKIEVKRGH